MLFKEVLNYCYQEKNLIKYYIFLQILNILLNSLNQINIKLDGVKVFIFAYLNLCMYNTLLLQALINILFYFLSIFIIFHFKIFVSGKNLITLKYMKQYSNESYLI